MSYDILLYYCIIVLSLYIVHIDSSALLQCQASCSILILCLQSIYLYAHTVNMEILVTSL